MSHLMGSLIVLFSLTAFSEGLPPMPPLKPGEHLTPPAHEEYFKDALKVGVAAPQFSLPAMVEPTDITLSSFKGTPIVLIFGSYTCPVFRGQVQEIYSLYEKYKDKYVFLFVYIREAHPGSKVFIMKDGQEVLEVIHQTQSVEERRVRALQTAETFGLEWPTLIEKEDRAVTQTYAGWPVRFVVLNESQQVVYKGGMGPFGFWAKDLAEWLKKSVL